MFDFNKCLEYIEILEKTGAETLVFRDYQVGIEVESTYYIDIPLFDSEGNFVKWENLIEQETKKAFAENVADYFLGVDEK